MSVRTEGPATVYACDWCGAVEVAAIATDMLEALLSPAPPPVGWVDLRDGLSHHHCPSCHRRPEDVWATTGPEPNPAPRPDLA